MTTYEGIQPALLLPTERIEHPPAETVNVGNVNPSWMPPLADFNVGTTVYKWHRFEYHGGSDLELCSCGDDGEDIIEWTAYDPIPDVMDAVFTRNNFKYLTWALQHGLSPGQPFLACIEKPEYYESGGWDGPVEFDAEYDWRMVRVLPVNPLSAAKAWAGVLHRIQQYEIDLERYQDNLRKQALSQIRKWHLHECLYGYNGGTLRITLTCKLKGGYWREIVLAAGESSTGREHFFKEAFWRLVDDFRKRHPTEDIASVLSLAGDRVPISRWDRLRLTMQHSEDAAEG